MKKTLSLILLTVLLVACGGKSGDNDSGAFKNGTYTGSGEGRAGTISVEVVVKSGKIDSLTVTDNNETPTYMQTIEEHLIPEIIENNTWEIDSITGATMSSNGVKDAVKDALSNAQ